MVLVPLVNGIHTVKHHVQPFRSVVRHHAGIVPRHHGRIPGSVGFQIRLVNHIEPILVAETVDQGIVRIVAGTDGINIAALHRLQIFAKFRLAHMTSAHRTELMAVGSLEHNPSAVQSHDMILHPEPSEAGLLLDHLL